MQSVTDLLLLRPSIRSIMPGVINPTGSAHSPAPCTGRLLVCELSLTYLRLGSTPLGVLTPLPSVTSMLEVIERARKLLTQIRVVSFEHQPIGAVRAQRSG